MQRPRLCAFTGGKVQRENRGGKIQGEKYRGKSSKDIICQRQQIIIWKQNFGIKMTIAKSYFPVYNIPCKKAKAKKIFVGDVDIGIKFS